MKTITCPFTLRAGTKSRRMVLLLLSFLFVNHTWSQSTVPFTLYNNSAFADANVYVAVVGIINDNHVWLDTKTGAVRLMNVSDNTVAGPVIGGNQGPGNNGRYANCFAKLSEIPNKTINIPGIAGCRILISFNSQLFLYFFGASGAPSGYAAPNLANPTDPNQGIRFETIELTNAANGLWANTTRVDSYQYPMGLEVWGNNNFYKKVGELKTHAQILSQWQSQAPATFAGCYDATNGIIKFPSKTSAFQSGGAQANYFGSYIDAIWSKYANENLIFNAGDAGTWSGRVSGNTFSFTRTSDGAVGVISNKPTNTEVMEGSGVMASGGQWDKVVQAQICAAINRHAIDLTLGNGATQDLGTDSKYYVSSPYNWYCKFWHQPDISLNSLTYSFCYDDVFNKSS
ncbi:MAG: glycoside hydrolase family 64 protein, partial [Niastella sp.]|uniref:glycoside hydrolase family 64 protein n=1 Tax=Niastella sp. TaxID=1869183 RepID=UPI0038999EA3